METSHKKDVLDSEIVRLLAQKLRMDEADVEQTLLPVVDKQPDRSETSTTKDGGKEGAPVAAGGAVERGSRERVGDESNAGGSGGEGSADASRSSSADAGESSATASSSRGSQDGALRGGTRRGRGQSGTAQGGRRTEVNFTFFYMERGVVQNAGDGAGVVGAVVDGSEQAPNLGMENVE